MAAESVASKTNAEARRRVRSRSKSDFMGLLTSLCASFAAGLFSLFRLLHAFILNAPNCSVRCTKLFSKILEIVQITESTNPFSIAIGGPSRPAGASPQASGTSAQGLVVLF